MREVPKTLEKVFKERYCLPNENTLEDVINRVSAYIADNKKDYSIYKESLMNGWWMASSPFLMNAGTKFPMCSACFALDIEDSIDSIFETLKRTAHITKLGGGIGINFSKIREKNAPIASSGGKSSGVISWMRMFNQMIEEVKQGGKRRGALIGILNYNHPDIKEFVTCKTNGKELTNFNISVLVDDVFMMKVEKDEDYDLISPLTNKPVGKMNARTLFNEICLNNWKYAEPALLFRDNINKNNPLLKTDGYIETCNPCGEIPMYPNGCCCLASANLSEMVDDGRLLKSRLESTTRIMYDFLSSALEKQQYPDELIETQVKRLQQLGIGICGLHDALIKLDIPYDSDKGRETAKEFVKIMMESLPKNKIKKNFSVMTIAPTGTISQILGYVSTGCEPEFALTYTRNVRVNEEIVSTIIVAPVLEEYCKSHNIELTEELKQAIANNKGSVKGLDQYFTKEQQKVLETAQDISWQGHIKMQAALQTIIDNSISKTCNLPNSATVEDIKNIYITAWKSGIKGTTIYRDGSLDSQVLNTSSQKEKVEDCHCKTIDRDTIGITHGVTYPKKSSCGKMYITLNRDKNNKFVESFINTSKGGICQANMNAVNRLASLAIRSGVSIEEVIKQLKGIVCPACVKNRQHTDGISCPDILARTIEEFVKEDKPETPKEVTAICPECGEPVRFEGGCVVCGNCGWSKCS